MLLYHGTCPSGIPYNTCIHMASFLTWHATFDARQAYFFVRFPDMAQGMCHIFEVILSFLSVHTFFVFFLSGTKTYVHRKTMSSFHICVSCFFDEHVLFRCNVWSQSQHGTCFHEFVSHTLYMCQASHVVTYPITYSVYAS